MLSDPSRRHCSTTRRKDLLVAPYLMEEFGRFADQVLPDPANEGQRFDDAVISRLQRPIHGGVVWCVIRP